MNPPRLTLRAVAARAKVSAMTVSLALRDQPVLPLATRRRIQAVAREMGYRPDPVLAALNRYRNGLRPSSRGLAMAYVTSFDTKQGWMRYPYMRRTFEGAEARARELGYHLERFWMGEPRHTPQRLASILESRGIRSLLVAPLPRPGRLEFPWENFSAVAIGPSLVAPALHSVLNNHYQSMLLALENIAAAGYRRIGLILDPEVDRRHQQKYLAALTIFQTRNRRGAVPPLLSGKPAPGEIRRWLKQHAPDAVLGHDDAVLDWLRGAGIRVPERVAFASLSRGTRRETTGVEAFPEAIAAAAVNRLHQLLQENETGAPELPTCLMLNGIWIAGETLPPRPAPAARAGARRTR